MKKKEEESMMTWISEEEKEHEYEYEEKEEKGATCNGREITNVVPTSTVEKQDIVLLCN